MQINDEEWIYFLEDQTYALLHGKYSTNVDLIKFKKIQYGNHTTNYGN